MIQINFCFRKCPNQFRISSMFCSALKLSDLSVNALNHYPFKHVTNWIPPQSAFKMLTKNFGKMVKCIMKTHEALMMTTKPPVGSHCLNAIWLEDDIYSTKLQILIEGVKWKHEWCTQFDKKIGGCLEWKVLIRENIVPSEQVTLVSLMIWVVIKPKCSRFIPDFLAFFWPLDLRSGAPSAEDDLLGFFSRLFSLLSAWVLSPAFRLACNASPVHCISNMYLKLSNMPKRIA